MSLAVRPSLPQMLLALAGFATWFAAGADASAQGAYVAQMRGQVNVPANGSPAKGSAIAVLDAASSTLKYTLDVTGLSGSVTSAEADWAAVGVNGPMLFALDGVAPHFAGTSPALTTAQVAELQAGRVYFTVRTTSFPLGQIRGQLTLGATQFYTLLNGAKVVPPSPTTATGYATFGLLSDNVQLTCMLHAAPLFGGPAYLHEGAPGATGATIGVIPYDASGVWHAVLPLTPLRVEMLKAGLVYVEIPSTPDAIVRGQLTSTIAQFGVGSGATPLPALTLSGSPTPNGYVGLQLGAGAPNSFALILVSTSAGLASAAGCPIYVDLASPILIVVPLDAGGNSYLPLSQLPASTPTPLVLTCQAIFPDPSAANGHFKTSNGATFNVTTFPD